MVTQSLNIAPEKAWVALQMNQTQLPGPQQKGMHLHIILQFGYRVKVTLLSRQDL